jgi:hypothetical protein
MTNPTSNFGWQMPTSTDLVTDLPADFEVFGQAVDTDFVDLLGGTTGQVLSKTSATDLDFTWINNDTGDITGVTAGTGITGGGTSGTVTVTNDMATTITAAGDIVVGTGSGTYDNLPIGTTAQVLTADTTVSPYKVKWATPAAASSGLVLITRATFSNVATTTTTFDNVFSSTYNNYVISMESIFGQGPSGDDFLFNLRTAGPTTISAAYAWTNSTYTVGTTTQTITAEAYSATKWQISGDVNTNAERFAGVYDLGLRSTANPMCVIAGRGVAASSGKAVDTFGYMATAANYTGFILSTSSTNISGTVAVYGLATS